MPLSTLALDFDGVLVDSQPIHAAAWRHVLDKRQIAVRDLDSAILGRSATEFATSLGLARSEACELANAKERAVRHMALTALPPLCPNVAETMPLLAREFLLVVVTSADSEFVADILRGHDLAHMFRDIFTGQKTRAGPSPYSVCLSRLKVEPDSVVAVEDSVTGIASARAAGLRVVAVTHTTPRTQLSDADVVIDNFGKLPEVLSSLGVAA